MMRTQKSWFGIYGKEAAYKIYNRETGIRGFFLYNWTVHKTFGISFYKKNIFLKQSENDSIYCGQKHFDKIKN
jgi:hypothetical protein